MRGRNRSMIFRPGLEGGSDPLQGESYIVRIYRRGRKNPRLMVGTVEEIGVEGKKGFNSFEELRRILSDSPSEGGRGDPAARSGRQRGAS